MAAAPARKMLLRRMGGAYGDDELRAVQEILQQVMRGGDFFPEPEAGLFEAALASYAGVSDCVAMSSCATALDACMQLLGIGPGDEVITTPLTFVCSASTAALRGARVVFADVEPESLNLDPQAVRAQITPRTRAIIPVHFAGLACDIDAFDALSAELGVPVVYDAAHALGTLYRGQPIGGRGLATCYSFQFHKTMTTLGEGGALTTCQPAFAERVRQARSFGFSYPRRDSFEGGVVLSLGTNYQMTKLQCAVGLVQLKRVPSIIAQRRQAMGWLHALLADIPQIERPCGHGDEHGSLLYVVRTRGVERAALMDALRSDYGIHTTIHYPPVWDWPAYRAQGYSGDACPVARQLAPRVLTLPVSTETTHEDCEYMADAIRRVAARLSR